MRMVRAKRGLLLATSVLLAAALVPTFAHGASGSYTRSYYPALQGSFLTPCENRMQAGPLRNDVNGVCFKLTGAESLPAAISITDAAGVTVRGSVRFLQYGPLNGGGSGWVELGGSRYFCGNTIALSQIPTPDHPDAFYLQVQLGAGALHECLGTVGAGTTGTVTFSFTTG